MVDDYKLQCYTAVKRTGDNKTSNWAALAIGILATLFATSLRMGVGMRIVRFTVKRESAFTLIRYRQRIEHEMQIKFALSKLMAIINWLTLFPPKREPITAEIRFRHGDETKWWPYRGIWKDTGTIETMVNDVCIKSLLVATYHEDKWFPINEVDGESLPNKFTIEVQLRSQRNGKLFGEPLREEIITEDRILTEQGIILE
jgi:hypothetical protein